MISELVEIEWFDSRRPVSEWEEVYKITEPEAVVCISVGWIIKVSANALTLAPNLGDGDYQACGFIQIPLKCIEKLIVFKSSQYDTLIDPEAIIEFARTSVISF